MKVIVAGSRGIFDYDTVAAHIDIQCLDFDITEIVSGTAVGVDRLGERWAGEHGVSVKKFPANWQKFGTSAGYRRNVEMAEYADALIAIWDGKSKGTKHMIDIAHKQGLHTVVVRDDSIVVVEP